MKQAIRYALSLAHITTAAIIAVYFAMHFAPTIWWYEYESIKPTKAAWVSGEKLKMVSTHRVFEVGTPIDFQDQLRCVTDAGDDVVSTQSFSTALKGPVDKWRKTPWTWGVIPANTPKNAPCYIRSVQTLSLFFGVKRTTEVLSYEFTVSH